MTSCPCVNEAEIFQQTIKAIWIQPGSPYSFVVLSSPQASAGSYPLVRATRDTMPHTGSSGKLLRSALKLSSFRSEQGTVAAFQMTMQAQANCKP